jgi:hypothetical protein
MQGVDGVVEGTIVSSTHNAEPDTTSCAIEESILTENLASIKVGDVYADRDDSSSNLPPHGHEDNADGGYIPAATMSEAQVENAKSFPIPGTGDAKKYIEVLDTEDGYEVRAFPLTADQLLGQNAGDTDIEGKTLQGTANRVTVSHAAGSITLSTPQDQHTSASPTYAGLTLSGLTGILEGKGASALAAVAATAALQVLTRNAGNTAYEFADPQAVAFTIAGQSGETVLNLVYGNVVYCSTVDGKWRNAQSDGTEQEADAWGVAATNPSIGPGESGTILLFGPFTSWAYSFTPGSILYVPDAPGAPTQTPPTIPIIIGHAITATQIFFAPVPQECTQADNHLVAFTPTNYAPSAPASARDEERVAAHLKGIDTALGSVGGGVLGCAPDYTPPAIKYKDADEIYVPKGRYYKAGHRIDGQYQDTANMDSYWDVASAFAVDVDDPVNLLGGDVVSSWYSVFLIGAFTVQVLPYIRARLVALDGAKTKINPGNHDDGTTQNDNFVTANELFNGYRLILLCDTVYHGTVYEISDSVNGTPDEIRTAGDKTGEIVAKDWLQMIPPSGTACLYLGTIRFDASGNILQFWKQNWRTIYAAYIQVNANASTSEGNTEIAPAVPPVAKAVNGYFAATTTGISVKGIIIRTYTGSSGANQIVAHRWSNETSALTNVSFNERFSGLPITAVSIIRNKSTYLDSSYTEQPMSGGSFNITGFEE